MWVESVRRVDAVRVSARPQQPVGAVALGEPVAEVGQDAVVESRVFQLQAEGVLEVGAAAHCDVTGSPRSRPPAPVHISINYKYKKAMLRA
jgi:hypothetical protein